MDSCKYYGEFSLRADSPALFEKSDENIDLLFGLRPNIKAYEKISDEFCNDWFNSKCDCGLLTDHINAKEPDCNDPAWFHFTSGGARSVIFDLGCVCSVESAGVQALKDSKSGVRLPTRVCVALSENGTNWQSVSQLVFNNPDDENAIVCCDETFSQKYRARFAKFSFSVPVHVFMDSMVLMGCRNGDNAVAIVPDKASDSDYPDVYCTAEQLGAKDVLLAYFCLEGKEPVSKEIFLPHVAYMQGDEIKDTLFDGYLFLPYVAFLYKGYEKKPLTKEKWQWYIDQQFIDGYNMDALNEAAKEVGEKLGIKDFKLSVYMSILYPVTSVDQFGVVDGKNLDFSCLEDRKLGLKWFIDEQYSRFNAKKYEYLDLKGYYWFTEEINYNDSQLLELLRYTTDYVRDMGLITTWIPYFHASGYDDWRHLGFDMACYQPNYAFNQNIPDIRLFEAANTAKLLGMCIELESGGIDKWNIERMKKYYAAGAITGYMKDAAHMYYQNGVPGDYYAAYKSDDEYLHSMYEDTYKFIKGKFNPNTVEFKEEDLLK